MTRRRRTSPRCSECGALITWARDSDADGAWRPLDVYLEQGRGHLYALAGASCWELRETGMGHPDHRRTCPARTTDRPNPPHPAVAD